MVKLDILSDPVCPWCYVGKSMLDRALEAAPGHSLTVEWHPFQLNPDMPAEGADRSAYLRAKFGDGGRIADMETRISGMAREAGVEIDWARVTRVPNTIDAHRLIHWAGIEGRQSAAVSALFRAYWREGRDIGDRAVLAGIAGEAGLDPVVVGRLLDSEADVEDIRERDRHARERGVTGVPTFIIANRYVVSGAQPAAFWTQVIAELAGRAA